MPQPKRSLLLHSFVVAFVCFFLGGQAQPPEFRPRGPEIIRSQPVVANEALRSYKDDPRLSHVVRMTVALAAGPVQFIIRALPEDAAIAQRLLPLGARFLVEMEKVAQPLPKAPRGTITVHGLGGVMHGFDDVNSQMTLGAALLFHELGHFWFDDDGLVSFLPIALHHGGVMPVSPADYAQILANWGWTSGSDPDFPLSEFKTTDSAARKRLVYTKGFKMHHMLMKELGPSGYLAFLKRIAPRRQFDAEHYFRELEATRPRDWRAFLSGWLIRGQYGRFSPASFQDTDGDGLVDIDEAYAGTDPKRMDTDGDGYSDSYELARGFDPLSRASRPSPDEPAIDGVAEVIGFEPEAEISDARGEAEQGDIAGMSVYKWGSKYYVRIKYVSRPAPSAVHTLLVRTAQGRNFWIQTIGARPDTYWVSEFPDGTPGEKWKKLGPQTQPKLQIAVGEITEFLLDLKEFSPGDVVWFQYVSGGRKAGQDIWNADETQPLAVALEAVPLRMDGSGADFLSVLQHVSISDPQGDCHCDSNIHDIKALHAARQGEWLYVLVTFHNDIRLNQHLPLTLHVRFPETGRNFWMQTFGMPGWFWVGLFADGIPFERWEKLPPSEVLRSIAFARNRDFEVRIPWRLFAGMKGPATIMAIVGSTQGGKPLWNADETGYLAIPDPRARGVCAVRVWSLCLLLTCTNAWALKAERQTEFKAYLARIQPDEVAVGRAQNVILATLTFLKETGRL